MQNFEMNKNMGDKYVRTFSPNKKFRIKLFNPYKRKLWFKRFV